MNCLNFIVLGRSIDWEIEGRIKEKFILEFWILVEIR